jgi:probable selenium-dependent hydroxylase accessory protein YqeC
MKGGSTMTNLLSSLAEQLPRCTAIIGGGGKTTLMLALAQEKAQQGASVLVTTTTHLAWPPPASYAFCSPKEIQTLRELAIPGKIVVAGDPCGNGRMTGFSPDANLSALPYDVILVEADGSNRLPLKYHRSDEPCVPACGELILQVAGLSALGRPIWETVHRWQLAGYSESTVVTPEVITQLLLWGRETSSLPSLAVLNQADTPALSQAGETICSLLKGHHYESLVCSLRKEGAPCWC